MIDGVEWTGQYQDIEVTDWWCPTYAEWVECPGPCPDGTPHVQPHKRIVKAKLMKRVGERGDDDSTVMR